MEKTSIYLTKILLNNHNFGGLAMWKSVNKFCTKFKDLRAFEFF